jgi:protein-tyrosine-phosphatase/predicted NBD/HSP70 family sugar kinase
VGADKSCLEVIGISWASPVANGKIAGGSPIVQGLKPEDFDWLKANFNEQISKEFNNAFTWVSNDGNSGLMGAYIALAEIQGRTIGFGLGTALAFGFIDENGNLNLRILGEGGNVIMDLNPQASQHTYTRVPGVTQRYLSQHGVKRVVYEYGLNDWAREENGQDLYKWNDILVTRLETLLVSGQMPQGLVEEYQAKLKEYKDGKEVLFEAIDVGLLLAVEDPDAVAVYQEIGRYVAMAAVEFHRIFSMENVILFGGVVNGTAGHLIKAQAEKVLSEEFPELGNIAIYITPDPTYGGANGAAYLAYMNRPVNIPDMSAKDGGKFIQSEGENVVFNILCVCSSNYNRSPSMEMVFADLIRNNGLEDRLRVNSGGVKVENSNGWGQKNEKVEIAFRELTGRDPPYEILSKSLSLAQVRNADLIVVPTIEIEEKLVRRFSDCSGLMESKEIVILDELGQAWDVIVPENAVKLWQLYLEQSRS